MQVLKTLFKPFALSIVAMAIFALGQGVANADPVTFSTTGVFNCMGCLGSGTNSVTFMNINGSTTLTFNGTTNPVNTPAGTSFGDIVVTTTVLPGASGPPVGGFFTLTFNQIAPPGGPASLIGTLSGSLGFDTGIATLNFPITVANIGSFTYTVNQTYTIALPVTGVGGGAGIGTTTLQGTVVGSTQFGNVPEPASMLLLGTGLVGVAGAARRRFQKRG